MRYLTRGSKLRLGLAAAATLLLAAPASGKEPHRQLRPIVLVHAASADRSSWDRSLADAVAATRRAVEGQPGEVIPRRSSRRRPRGPGPAGSCGVIRQAAGTTKATAQR
jgi:hypothetical protein